MNRIKNLRSQKNMSQGALAEVIGVYQPVISAWESGSNQRLQDSLIILADYFDVSIDYITGRMHDLADCYN